MFGDFLRVQDDVVMGTLTVRENFAFSAALRLPTSVTQEEKEQKVDKLIQELGLGRVADSRVRSRDGDRRTHRRTNRQNEKKTCVFAGGHSADSWDLWRREEEDEHRYGADHRPARPLPG